MTDPRDRPMNLAPASVMDYRELARAKLPRQLFDYIDGGAYTESTMRANVSDLRSIHLRQRILRDVSDIDLGAEVLGEKLSLPVVLGPVGLVGMFARRGEVLAAKAAEQEGIRFCESTVSICSIEEVKAATNVPFWFQLYVMRDRGYAEDLIGRAKDAGCSVLVLTVDLAVVGARYRDTRNGMMDTISLGKKIRRGWDILSHLGWVTDVAMRGKPLTFGNLESAVPTAQSPAGFKDWIDGQFDPSVTWDDLAWVRKHWPGKVILKGILDVADARRAVDVGADGIVVSNHGGRQLDGALSSIRMLRPILDAVQGDIEVHLDSGVRSGQDVLKALAMG
ncbi:MAG: L-lactate dehydrogenase, partial [Polyangiales bacterium]